VVYGGLAVVLAAKGNKWQRVAVLCAGVALVAAIAVTRVVINSHTILETVIGIAIGGLALALFGAGYFPRAGSTAALRPLILAVAILMVVLHGQQLHAEELVRAIGDYLRTDGLACR
jgi:hypothetical protein